MARHVFFAARRVHSWHWAPVTTYSTSKICCRMVDEKTWESGRASEPCQRSDRKRNATHLLLDRELDPQTLGVRLSPNKARVDEADLCEALELAQADGEELARLELGAGPGGRGRQPALASAAERDGGLLGDAVGDVDAEGGKKAVQSTRGQLSAVARQSERG